MKRYFPDVVVKSIRDMKSFAIGLVQQMGQQIIDYVHHRWTKRWIHTWWWR